MRWVSLRRKSGGLSDAAINPQIQSIQDTVIIRQQSQGNALLKSFK
jgi:hypothetical protein